VLYALVKQVLFACYRSNNGQSSRDFWATIFHHKTVSSRENRWTPFQFVKKSWQYWDISYWEILWIGLWTLFAWFLHHHFTVTKWRRLKKNYERIFNFSQKWEYYEIFLFTKKAITPNRRQRRQLSSKVGFRQQLFFFINVLKIHGTAGSMKSWPTMAAGVIGATCLTATTSNTSEWQRQVFASREKTQVQCQLTFFVIFLVHIKQFVRARETFILWLNKELLKIERTHFQVVLKKTYM